VTKWAAVCQYRVFFLGGAPGVAASAADKLLGRYPGLEIAGLESPPYRPMTPREERELIERIRGAKPDIVYVAFGQPKGELWIEKHYEEIGAPICVQVGASFDFVAGGDRSCAGLDAALWSGVALSARPRAPPLRSKRLVLAAQLAWHG